MSVTAAKGFVAGAIDCGIRKENRLDLAMADVERAVSIDPNDAEALLERGILRERTLRDDEVAQWAAQIVAALKSLGGVQR